MSKFFKIKSEQLKPTTPKPATQPANGYQWSWNVNTMQWEQVPINSQYSYNITDSKNTINTTNQTTIQTTGYTTASLRITNNILACLNQFIDGDDFNDGILLVNGLKFKPTAKIYEDGLVKYAGYDVMNGSLVKITAKGLDYLKNNEQKIYNKLKKQIESNIDDTTDIPSTIPGFDFPCEGIRPEDGTYDTDNKKFAKYEDIMSAKEMNHIIDILENKYYNEIYDAFENENLDKKLKEILINEDLRVDDTTFGRIVEYFDVLFL